MKITQNINLGGIIFTIDEDALAKLENYLNSVERFYSDKDEREEILADIEARISEHFQSQLNERKEVVTMAEVDKAIEIIGLPEDFDGIGSRRKTTYHRTNYNSYKKLFRDPDNSVLGGICSGFGYYFSIDPVIIRVIFVLLGFFAGGIILYIVLWIVLPQALSSAEKQRMRGAYRNQYI